MSEVLLIWLFGGAYGGIAITLGLHLRMTILYARLLEKRSVEAADIAVIKQMVMDVRDEIGDHDSGLRGSIHKLRSEISPYIIGEQKRRGQ